MPLYEYECGACGKRFEMIQKFSDPPPGSCRVCGKGPTRRLASSPAIQFKGSGWYITDYAQKDRKSKSDASSTEKTEGSSGSGTAAEGGTTGGGGSTSEGAATSPAASTTAAKSKESS